MTDVAPTNVTFSSWTCAIGLAGSGPGANTCTDVNGASNILTSVSLRAGATAVYTINATIGAAATGTMTNTAFEALPPGVTQDPTINRPDSDPADVIPIVINVAKSEALPVPTGSNTYSLTYTMTVTNSGFAAGSYNLSDVFQFGTGISVTGTPVVTYSGASTDSLGTAIIGGFTGAAPNTLIVSNEPIASGKTDVFTITVNITVNPATATAMSVDCTLDPGETGTGTRNTATLSGNASGSATACQPLPLIQILKTQPAPIATGPNTYLVTYTITVTNIGGASGIYDLDDKFQFGAGISVVVTPTVTYSAASTDSLTTTINAAWAGAIPNTRIVTSEPIAGTRTDVYTISVNIAVDSNSATPTSLDCNLDPGETGTGTRNNASLGGNAAGSSTSCQALANIVIAKTAATPTPTGIPNQYQVVYTITTSNVGAAAGTYNLDDQFQFGAGITVVGTPVVAYAPASSDNLGTTINAAFTGATPNARIVTNEPLAASETDVFTVTVTVQVNPTTATPTSVDCNLDPGETGTGLRNLATLSGNAAGSATTCQPLPLISIAKTQSAPVPTGPNTYLLTYTITVSNSGAAAGSYNLDDQFQFGTGVSVVGSPVVTYSGASTGVLHSAINAAFTGAAPNQGIVTNETIAAGRTDVFTITVGVVVDPMTATASSLDCSMDLGENGTGTRNTTSISGDGSGSATACQPLPLITINKTQNVPVPTGANTYTLTYFVTVSNIGATSGTYNLDDAFNFGAGVTAVGTPTVTYDGMSSDTLTTAINAGYTGATPNTRIVTNEPLMNGHADVFKIVVNIQVNPGAVTPGSLDCNLDSGETGTGTRNTASLGGNAAGNAASCQPLAIITVAKSAGMPTPGSQPGQYQIVYTLTIANLGAAAGSYDLDDVFQFGAGVLVSSTPVVAYSGTSTDSLTTTINTGFMGTATDSNIVTAEPLAAGKTDVFTITVNIVLDPLAATPISVDCTLQPDETGTGLRNTATLGGNSSGSATDCQPLPTFSLGNRVWKDLNNSGTIDAADGATPGVNGVIVRLLNAATLAVATDITGAPVADQTTANGGYYRFDNLAAGDYIVEIRASNFTGAGALTGCVSSINDAGDPDVDADDNDDNGVGVTPNPVTGIRSAPVTLGPAVNSEPTNETDRGPGDPTEPNGSTNLTMDFGFTPVFSLGNRVWKDLNNSGTIDAADGGAPGVNGVIVRLLNASTLAQAVDANGVTVPDQTTANGGYYRFDNLLAVDYIVEIRSVNFTSTGALFGCASSAPGGEDPDTDPTDSDDNGVGIMPGANGIRSLPVTLGPAPGSEPTNETDRSPSDPAEPNGNTNLTVDFGFVPTYSLGNRVWKDLNNSGTIDAADGPLPGIAGVVLRLLSAGTLTPATDASGNAVPNQTSSGFGYYRFDNLLAGDYVVEIVASNFAPGGALVGCVSSTGGGTEPASDPDFNPADNDDNGEAVAGVVRSKPVTLGPTVNSEPINETDIGPTDPIEPNGMTNLSADFGFYGQTDLSLTKTAAGDPCNGATISYTLTVRNNGPTATSTVTTVTDTLPNGITPVAAVGTGWTCSINGQMVTCTSQTPIPVNGTSTVVITAGIGYNISGTVTNTSMVSISSDPNTANNSGSATITVASGFGVPGQPFENGGSSVLVYPIFTSNPSNPNDQNTSFNLTNTNTQKSICVHLFFVDGASCSVADSIVCLTPNQTTRFLASDLDPGTTGYLVAVAIDCTGCPMNYNFLIGDEYVKFSSGHRGNLIAEGAAALPALPTCNSNSVTAQLNFDGVNYSRFGRTLALDSFGSRADGNDTMIVVDRIGGNLGTGAATLGTLFGILYDDAEIGLSFNVTGVCQLRSSLSNNFPRTTPRFESFIPAGRTGWLKLFSQSDIALVGASINYNANAGSSAGAFNGAHNLHKLTLSSAGSYVIPVFPASGCQ